MLSEILQDLKIFLPKAKRATYIKENGDEKDALLPGALQLEFSEGKFLYRDIYLGQIRLAGQEIVYFQERPVWSMTYSGGLLAGTHQEDTEKIYAFLRQALRSIPDDFPVRGKPFLAAGDWRYNCEHTGTLSAFHGKESILCAGHAHYELYFAGGMIV